MSSPVGVHHVEDNLTFAHLDPLPDIGEAATAAATTPRRTAKTPDDCLLRPLYFTNRRDNHLVNAPTHIKGQVRPAVQMYFYNILSMLGRQLGCMLNMTKTKTITKHLLSCAWNQLPLPENNIVLTIDSVKKLNNDLPGQKTIRNFVHFTKFVSKLKGSTCISNVLIAAEVSDIALLYCLSMTNEFLSSTNEVRKAMPGRATTLKSRHIQPTIDEKPLYQYVLGTAAMRVIKKHKRRV
jgi:hypothetical protein